MSYLSPDGQLLAVFGQQIPHVLQVQLDVRARHEVGHVRRSGVLDVRPDVAEGARDDPLVVRGALHGVGLAGAGLAVREHAAVEAVEDGRDQRTDLGKSIFLSTGKIYSKVM